MTVITETVHCCPQCGHEMQNHCHHDGDNVDCEDMDLVTAWGIARRYADDVLGEYRYAVGAADALADKLEKHLTAPPIVDQPKEGEMTLGEFRQQTAAMPDSA